MAHIYCKFAGKKLRRGGVTFWVLLSATVIFGVVALGLDGGRLMDERRHAQATADAAALAAANDLYQNWWTNHGKDPSQTAQAAALQLAAANGYANDGTTSVVTVNVPPKSGAFAGKANFVEVIVEYHLARSFAAVFTGGDLIVRGRAVAVGRPARMGLLLLKPNGADALVNKSLLFAVLNEPIVVNSSDPAAYDQAAFGVVLASSFQVTGNYVNPGGAIILGRIQTGMQPTPDPLRNLAAPDPKTYAVQSAAPLVINSLLPTTLNPGVYKGGIQINGLSIVFMMPGVYIMDGGGFQITGLSTVIGTGVMIYNTSGSFPAGPITVNSVGKIALIPPLGGTYQGIGIFQDRSMNQTLNIFGNGLTAIVGTVYAPSAPVNLTGLLALGIDTLGGAYICSTMQVSGVGTINISLGNNYPRVPDVTLVE
jgi:hypothetical protein